MGSGAAKGLVEPEGTGSEQNAPSRTGCQVEGGEAEASRFWEEGLGALHAIGGDVEAGAGWQKRPLPSPGPAHWSGNFWNPPLPRAAGMSTCGFPYSQELLESGVLGVSEGKRFFSQL